MPTRRMITSEIWEDEFIGGLSFFERLLWIGLITLADDQGRVINNSLVIMRTIYLYDENVKRQQVEEAIAKITKAGKLVSYEAGRKSLLQIVNWWKHQDPQWAQASQWPAPIGWTDRVRRHIKGTNKVDALNWEATGGYADVPTDVPTSVPTDVPYPIDEISTREDKVNAADAASPPEVPEEPPSVGQDNHTDRKELIRQFLIKTHLPAPRTGTKSEIKAAQKLWWGPADEILQLAGGDVGAACRLVDKALERLSEVTISDLNSLIKTVRFVYAEQERGGPLGGKSIVEGMTYVGK